MELASLKEFIDFLEYGTNLHIGVLFFGSYGNEKCALDNDRIMHTGILCQKFKAEEMGGFKRCLRCRNLALKKAMTLKEDFGGFCINGIYEYTRPVIIDNEVACVIYIGNILNDKGKEKIKAKAGWFEGFEKHMEKDFDLEKCRTLAMTVEGYIRVLLEKYSNRAQSTNSLIENIKSYIKSNLESELEITNLAKLFHFNTKYFGRLFKKKTGISLNQYICHSRLERAEKMLLESDDSILNISFAVGFRNVTYFNKMFKIKYNLSPKEYRRKSDSRQNMQ